MMSNVIRIYAHDTKEEDFRYNGLAVLTGATDVTVKLEINGNRTLEFNIPDREKQSFVVEENIAVIGGQRYRIKNISGTKVTAQAIYNDASYKHIQYIGDMMGVTPRNIMIQIFAGTPVHVMTEDEVKGIGMEWVDDITDFFACSKITPIGALKSLMDTLDKYKAHAELYVDNYNIALVKQIGTDRGVRIDAAYNAKEICANRDTTEMITRLYPYGKDGVHIGSVNSAQYIDSPNYAKWPREGYMDFDDIENPQMLLEAALKQFNENNPERIDIPQYSVTVSYAQRHENEIGLGDIVTVFDREFDVRSKQRVVALELHPFEPNKNTITVGNPPPTIAEVFNGVVDSTSHYQNSINTRGETKTGWLEMMQKNKKVTINNHLGEQEIALYKTGALFESPDGSCAVAIIQGQLAIAAGKTDGSWDWTTVIDDNEIIVSEVFTGTLYTEMVKLMGDGAKLTIENNLITMKDGDSDVVRMKLGYDNDSEQYLFEIRDADGNRTMYLDDDGNLTLTGVFKTGESGARIVIDGNGIQSYDNNGRKSGLFSEPVGISTPIFELYLDDESLFKIRGMNVDVPGTGKVLQCSIIGPNNTAILGVLGTTINPHGRWNFQTGDLTVNNKRVLTEDDLQNIN